MRVLKYRYRYLKYLILGYRVFFLKNQNFNTGDHVMLASEVTKHNVIIGDIRNDV